MKISSIHSEPILLYQNNLHKKVLQILIPARIDGIKKKTLYQLGFLEYGTYWYFWEPFYWTAPDKDDDFYSFLEFIFTQTREELYTNPLYTNYPPIKKKCDHLLETFAKHGYHTNNSRRKE